MTDATPAPPPEPLVSINVVSKAFFQGVNDVHALDRVSLNVARKEFVTIVGASGCGKSTLLNLIAGLLQPSEGAIELAPEVARRGGIGMVFQQPVLLPWRNVMNNVLAP